MAKLPFNVEKVDKEKINFGNHGSRRGLIAVATAWLIA